MATQGVATFRSDGVMTKLVVGCDGHKLMHTIYTRLVDGSLSKKTLADIIAKIAGNPGYQGFGRIVRRIRTPASRFTCPRWRFTVNETITVDLDNGTVEVSAGSSIAGIFGGGKVRTKNPPTRIGNWRIIPVFLPETNRKSQEYARRMGACWQ